MKIAIMQPYFLPYIGYFQLMNAVDEFVVYDNIEFTKKGWINRNRILVNGGEAYITLPLKKASDYLLVKDRFLSENWEVDRRKMISKIKGSYLKAPFFKEVFPLLQECVLLEERNLFKFILNLLIEIKNYLSIATTLSVSSSVSIKPELKSEEKVIAICKAKKATTYINPIGGIELYNKENFRDAGIELQFLQAKEVEYNQYNNEFVPWLSIVDVLMFNCKEKIQDFLSNNYTLN